MIKYIKYRDPRTGKIGYIRKNDAQLKSKSGSYGDHGNIFKTWWKYLTSNSNKIQKQTQNFDTNAYVKRKNARYGKRRNTAIELLDFINTGGNKNRGKKINPTATVRSTYQRPTQDVRTSQDRFQQSQYKKNTLVRKKQTVQRQQPITQDYQLDDVVITAKRPIKKTQPIKTTSRSNSYNTPVRKRPVRRVEREEPLPLLNNPNYINDNDVRGIQFIPQNFDGYDDIQGRRQSQKIIDDRIEKDRAYAALAQQLLDAPIVSNMDTLYNEFATPDEYNRGKIGYWW